MADVAPITRRTLLAALGLSLGGLALGVAHATEPSGEVGPGPRAASPEEEARAAGLNPNAFVHVGEDGVVTIVCHRSEMGQGVRSSIPILVADELGAAWDRVVVVQADGDPRYGDQNTDGSSSIRQFYDDLRRLGAVARTMLVAAAAREWRVSPERCEARDHAVHHLPTGRTLGFGELAPKAARLRVPRASAVALRPRSELRHQQAPVPLLDARAIVDGSAIYGADVRLEGELVAVIARPPVVGGGVARYDATEALAVPGVRQVVELPRARPPYGFQPWGGLAVIADHTWAAIRGRARLDVTWDDGPNATYDSTTFERALLASVRAPGTALRATGDLDAALASAARVVEAEYVVPHLAQLPMEPPAAVARITGDRCEIWAPTQHPQAARAEAARVLGWPEDRVTVHVTLLGGGFGRKSKADFVAEAAALAREVGRPVRLQWTREDDVRHGYYNAVNAQRLVAGLDADGRVVAWHQRTAFPPIDSTFGDAREPTAVDLQQGVLDLALDVPHVRCEACPADAHVRIGWYRSVYNIFHAFAAGSFVDEVAHARGADPRDVWLEVIGSPRALGLRELGVAELENYGQPLEQHPVDPGRLRRVIERVTDAAGWSAGRRAGRALGLAAHRSFLSYTAVVCSVVPDPVRGARVDEVWISMDAGTVVHRDRVLAQLEGAVVMGLGNALHGGVTMKGGRTEQANFDDARIPRIGDVPRRIHTDLVPSDGPPCGVGEPGVPPVAPALANAIFALTGRRLRRIPFAPDLALRA